ncbi:sulfatase [uncultured Lamprocystis sp.]|jgi:arylsulfatase A-like enzyme|uniref:sulfatase n=1 Tax=uncultured Lamprocystis sp. TaxID=543132 RepID=UPI0025EEE089|nr:sulfatase [uncultured Lamprocystis sp.]
MNQHYRFVLCLLAAMAPFAASTQAAPAKNVLLILTDDMNDELGCYGSPVVKSPNIDALADRGVRFNNANANYPVCNASRTSMLSGVYPESSRVYYNTDNPRTYLGPDWVMLPEYFHNQGYYTARVGKIAHDTFVREFHWDLDRENGVLTKTPPPYTTVAKGGVGLLSWSATTQLDEHTQDGRNARYVALLLEQRKGQPEPFFIAMGFRKPHTPWTVPKKYFDMYSTAQIKVPHESGEPTNDRADIPSVALTNNPEWASVGTNDERRKAILAAYASHSFVDAGVGVLLDALTRLDLWKDTVVVFASDHGQHFGEHGGLVAKHTLFAETTRVPFIIVAPEKSVAQVADAPVELLDLYPTLAELCGLPIPDANEGVSLVPLLDNPAADVDNGPAYSVVRRSGGGRSIRNGLYRYTEWGWGKVPTAAELYDLQADPGEFTNQIGNSAYRSILTSLQQDLVLAKTRPSLK